jgi:thymidylate kinase
MNTLKVIALSGPDGTGKTSCADTLVRVFSKSGFNVLRIWIKNVHTITIIVTLLVKKLSPSHIIKSTSGTFATSSLSKHRKVWLWLSFIGILIKLLSIKAISVIMKIVTRKRSLMVADRYILDSMVHVILSIILADVKNTLNNLETILKYLSNSIPFKIMYSLLFNSSTLVFVLDGDVMELIKRNAKVGKSDPYGYMTLQRLLYLKLIKLFNMPIIYINTTNKPLKHVCLEVAHNLLTVRYKPFY